VLPQSRGGDDNPAKYADTAILYMLSLFRRECVGPSELAAKIAGGACMFGNGQFTRIGESNVQAAIQALESAGIGIVGRDAGGNIGRRICFDLATGIVTVASVGRPPRTI